MQVDARMGPKTPSALQEFQRAKRLHARGELDRRALTALGIGAPKAPTGG